MRKPRQKNFKKNSSINTSQPRYQMRKRVRDTSRNKMNSIILGNSSEGWSRKRSSLRRTVKR